MSHEVDHTIRLRRPVVITSIRRSGRGDAEFRVASLGADPASPVRPTVSEADQAMRNFVANAMQLHDDLQAQLHNLINSINGAMNGIQALEDGVIEGAFTGGSLVSDPGVQEYVIRRGMEQIVEKRTRDMLQGSSAEAVKNPFAEAEKNNPTGRVEAEHYEMVGEPRGDSIIPTPDDQGSSPVEPQQPDAA